MNFDLTTFRHYAAYSPIEATARSFLVSTRAQVVHSELLDCDFSFASGETIYTEQSQKYARSTIEALARKTGFVVDGFVTDERDWYALVVCSAADVSPH